MSENEDRLYELLPLVYRQRDAQQGYPLRALLQVIAEQVNVVEADIRQLYENWFIETCQDWVVPYIADLVGYRPVHEAGEPGGEGSSPLRDRILIPRREVANTLRYRRRKGAAALLEELAGDVAGWPAVAVEYFPRLALCPSLQHLGAPVPSAHLPAASSRAASSPPAADMRREVQLDRVNGPFDRLPHSVDVRRPVSAHTLGRYNIPSAALFVWRLRPYSITRAPAYCEDQRENHYRFSILGNDQPLLTNPQPETDDLHPSGLLNVPTVIRRRELEAHLHDYYGPGKSLSIWRDGLEAENLVPLDAIVPADLSGWAYTPHGDQVAVDPQLGRIAFSPDAAPENGVWVSYYYGFSWEVGGGEYPRPEPPPSEAAVYRISQDKVAGAEYDSLGAALLQWNQDRRQKAVFLILDSGDYTEQLQIKLASGQSLEIRAAPGTRPAIRMVNLRVHGRDALRVESTDKDPAQPPRFTLDGLLISGRPVLVRGPLRCVTIRHCTLVPGWSLDEDCQPEAGTENSLELINTRATVLIERSILGTILVHQDEVRTDPLSLTLTDSILDATSPELPALTGREGRGAHAALTLQRCTVFGEVHTHAIDLGENSILLGRVKVARRQVGCLRFCYVTPGSRTPRRYHCQPDLVEAAVETQTGLTAAERLVKKEAERRRVLPQFNSMRYGNPTYCQLASGCAEEIRRGADDQSEMGVFHNLFQPQRLANLRSRLDEFTPAGMETGIIFES